MINAGLIGYGYWGPNLARTFNASADVCLKCIADKSEARTAKAKADYPAVDIIDDSELVKSSDVDTVIIATPVFTHYGLAKAALENGKHVYVEKPMASSSAQCRELAELAESKGLVLMVDHTFLFTGAVRKIKELVDSGALGTLYYYDSVRINLGLFQHDVNVIWDLAPHDFSIMIHLLGDSAHAVSAHGSDHFGIGFEDVAYVTVFFDNNLIAHFHLNWLAPTKIRSTIVGGSNRMLVWDDLNPEEKVRIYDKSADVSTVEGQHGVLANYRMGDMAAPVVPTTEALKEECSYFVDCIKNGKTPFNDGRQGLRVVELLEATDKSLKNNGEIINLR